MLTFRALSLRQITYALFVYSGVVWRHNKSMKIDFPAILMVHHRKVSTFFEKQNALANWASIKNFDLAKKCIQSIISNSVLIVEAKPVKS